MLCCLAYFTFGGAVKKIIVLVFTIFLCSHVYADELEDSRIELEAKKKIQISKLLKLTGDQSSAFWNVYADYERELSVITKDSFDLIRRFSEGYTNNSITEQSATNMLAEFFRIEAKNLRIKQSYLARYQEVLPTKKVLRFYQIDNKVDALIRCDIAKKLPLIEPDM